MRILTILLFLKCVVDLAAQQTFIKVIDIGHTDESAYQIIHYKDNYLVSYAHIDRVRKHLYSGVLEIDQFANVKKDRRFIDFSNNFNSIVIDSIHNKVFYTGEEHTLTNIPQSYRVYSLDYDTLDSLSLVEVIDSNRIYPIIYQNNAAMHNGQLVVSAQGNTPENHIMTAYLDPITLVTDTIVHIDNPEPTYRSISALEMYSDKEGYLTYITKSHRDTTTILRVDNNKKIIQYVSHEDSYCYGSYPVGCQLSDGRTIYNRCGKTNSLPEIVFLSDSSYEIVDKFEWRDYLPWQSPFPSQHGRTVYRLIEAKNGDIIGVGSIYWNEAPLPDPHYLNRSPLIFRIDSKGELLWYKALYNISKIEDSVTGYLFGVTELDDGSIMAVGDINNDIAFDSILGRPAQVPDILIVRMTADGCIDGYDCESLLYKVPEVTRLTTGIQDVIEPDKKGIFIYPNPGSISFSSAVPDQAVLPIQYKLTTLEGVALELGVHHAQSDLEIETSRLVSGIYILSIKDKEGRIWYGKWVKE